jgi:hypothetical protein
VLALAFAMMIHHYDAIVAASTEHHASGMLLFLDAKGGLESSQDR